MLSHNCGGQKSKTKEMSGLFPGESSLLGFQRAPLDCILITSPVCIWKERHSFSASSYKLLLFSHSVMSNSLQPRGLQHTMLPCHSPSPRTSSNSKSVMPSNHLILRRPLLLLPSIFPNIRIFSNVSALPIRWPKYWSFSFSISPSNEYSE